MEVSTANISKNISINQPASQENFDINSNVKVERRVNNQIYGKFINTHNVNGAIPLDMHVTSNLGTLRVFSDDRNLYEILLGKDAKHKSRDMNWYAAAGTTIGTVVPSLIIYAMKLKKGKANVNILEALKEFGSRDLKYEDIANKAREIANGASDDARTKLNQILEKIENEPNSEKRLKKLFKQAGLVKPEELNKEGFYFKEGKEKFFNNILKEAKELYIKDKKGKDVSPLRYLFNTDELSLSEVLVIGTGSVLGGLLGGIIKDKGKVNKKKVKESNFQLITNIILPTILTAKLIEKLGLSIKPPEGLLSTSQHLKRIGTAAAAIVLGVGTGITVGSHIANWVNKQYFKDQKYERKLQDFDVFIHVDDVPIALNFMRVPFMDKLLLFCSGLCGYKAGAKE